MSVLAGIDLSAQLFSKKIIVKKKRVNHVYDAQYERMK